MADVKKQDDNKIIKNPLLSQSFMLEELSGVSFIVAAPQKPQSVGAYGSKTDVDVTLLGEKKQSSSDTKERADIKDEPQFSQSFTDIPLNIPDLKTFPNDKLISPSQESIISNNEGEFGHFKSTLTSFLPFIAFPTPSNPPIIAKEKPKEINPSIDKGVQLGTKRQQSPQIFVPKLISPTPEITSKLPVLTSENTPPVKSDLNYEAATTSDLTTQFKATLTLGPPKPLSISNVNHSSLKNPYALRNNHNTVSNFTHLSKSPSSCLGTSDSVPLYRPANVTNSSSNFFTFLSGPQVTASSSLGTFPVDSYYSTATVQNIETNSSKQHLNKHSAPPLLKSYTLTQNIINEQTPDISPKIFSPPITSACVQNTCLDIKPLDNTHSIIPDKVIPVALPNVRFDTCPGQTTEKKILHSELNNQSIISPSSASNTLNNLSLNNFSLAKTTLTGPVNEETKTDHSTFDLKIQTEIQKSVSEPPIPTYSYAIQDVSKTFPEGNVQSVPLIPVSNSSSSTHLDFQSKLLQETYKIAEDSSQFNQSSEVGPPALGKNEIKESDELFSSSDLIVTKSSPFKYEESPEGPLGFQSKQVSTNNIPINESKTVEINEVVSRDVNLTENSSVYQQLGNTLVSNSDSLSEFLIKSPTKSTNTTADSSLYPVPDKPLSPSYSIYKPANHVLSPSTYFRQTQISSIGQNQQILDLPSPVLMQTYPPSHIENKAQAIAESSAVIPNSQATLNPSLISQVQNQSVITSIPIHSQAVATGTASFASPSSTNSAKSDLTTSSDAPSLHPQHLYTFPKFNSDTSIYFAPKPQTIQPSTTVQPSVDNAAPANPLIPTFNYFSFNQTSCLPPSLDQLAQKSTGTSKSPPSSYYFKPIQKPDSVSTLLSPPNSISTNIEPTSHILNPTPSAPPKIPIFPPPNVSYTKEIPSTLKQQTHTEVDPVLPDNDNHNCLDVEELDQIPLEGSAVPLFNPETINRKKKVDVPVVGNTFRLSGGIKKRTYAPVPDLGVTEKINYIPPTSPSMSASSQEEMAAIHENKNTLRTSPKTSESPLVVENYYGNVNQGTVYRPPYYHWFFKCGRDKKSPWAPFSMADSLNLEQVFTSSDLQEDTKVATDGGRYDVDILRRKKMSVYWDEPDGEVRRCAWFVKSVTDSRYIPYDENIAALLEDEYKQGFEMNEWNRKVELADGEVIILHGPSAIAHHFRSGSPDAWGAQPVSPQKPRVVKRGVEDFDIPKGEPKQVDHLLLVVHGIGKACDLRFRSLVEVVDDFRSISVQLVQSHFHSGVQNGMVGRVEVLPVEWHKALHTESIDDRLSAITLPSIPRAREFTNETLLDILFYTSPVFCEKIVQAVGAELNRVYALYQKRNPGFRGQVSLGAHSLGSLILFDMLCHQQPVQKPHIASSTHASLSEDDEDMDEVGFMMKAKLSRRMSYLTIGPGTGQPYTIYPQLLFQPKAMFAMGSPIGMFVTVRGIESLGEEFKFPTCPAFFNIFHPNDPVAYRIEALIKPEMAQVPAVLIPHHKGRKRMHLELKETMAHVTAALKQKLVDSMRNTWNAVYQLAMFNRKDHTLQGEVNKVIEDEVLREASYLDSDPPIGIIGEESAGNEVRVGKLNDGRRIDYVLQEAPLETFNQYISAIRSHLVYWESEDTMLLILKEIYGQMGISPDCQVPQTILPFDISGDSETYSEYTYSIGAPPTQFVRK